MPHRNLTLLALLVGASVPGFGGDRAVSTKPVGTMIGTGPVWLDGSPASEFSAPPGAALFGGDVIQTGKAGSAVVRLLSGTSATVAEKSTVVLDVNSGVTARPGASAALDLREGVLTVLSAGRQPTEVIIPGASVTLQSQPGRAAVCRVASVGRSAAVFADRGPIEVHGVGRPVVLASGEHLELAAGMPQGAAPTAGRVTDSTPYEVVLHPGEQVEVPLKLGEIVDAGDVIRTSFTGRVRIQFLGGSFLNVGPRSKMRLVKHDPANQQTDVNLNWGHLRGEAGKTTASMKVETATGAIEAAGAIFLVAADSKRTTACSVQGAVSVRNVDPGVSGAVKLADGQCTSVRAGQEPFSPRESAGVVQREMKQTEVPRVSISTITRPPRGAPGELGLAAGALAATGTAAGLAVADFVLINDAQNSASSANSHLKDITGGSLASDAAAAEAAAKAAASTAARALAAMQEIIAGSPSPSVP